VLQCVAVCCSVLQCVAMVSQGTCLNGLENFDIFYIYHNDVQGMISLILAMGAYVSRVTLNL